MYDIKINSFSFSSHKNIVIDSIEGFGPPTSTISRQKLGKDGTKFSGTTKDERNIVINFSILNDVKNTRELMYNEIPTGEEITLTVDNSKQAIGYIEKFEINNFQQLTTGQISIICPDPYFYSTNKDIIDFAYSGKYYDINPNTEDYVITAAFTGLTVNDFSYSIRRGFSISTYRINYSFNLGDVLVIDTLNRKITVNNKNIYGSKNWEVWGLFTKGTNNQVCYSTTKDYVNVTLTYRDRYIAI